MKREELGRAAVAGLVLLLALPLLLLRFSSAGSSAA
jgi:hypothetical protein